MTAKMFCYATKCCGFCCENPFGFEPSFPFVIYLAAQQTTAGISRHHQNFKPALPSNILQARRKCHLVTTPRTIALSVGAGRDGDIGWAAEAACMYSVEDTVSQTQGSDTKK